MADQPIGDQPIVGPPLGDPPLGDPPPGDQQVGHPPATIHPVAVAQSASLHDADPSKTGLEPGTLRVDQAVARTAQVWVDPVEDQISGADSLTPQVPKPHVAPGDSSMDTLHHLHTAYSNALLAAASANPLLVPAPSHSEPLQPVEPVPESPQEVDWPEELVINQSLTAEIVAEPETDISVDNAPGVPTGVPQGPPTSPQVAAAGAGNEKEIAQIRVDRPAETNRMHPVQPMSAVWEVDVLEVPTMIADLFFDGALFQQLADRMSEAVSTGLRTVLVTSQQRGEGRTTVAIGLAMASAATGIRVALVDADITDPTLADDLRLDLQTGWLDAIRQGHSVKESAVHAVEDGVTLIPLIPAYGPNAATAAETAQLIEQIRNRFDLVIIDGPTADSPILDCCATLIDSAVIVRDTHRGDASSVREYSDRLQSLGVKGVGVVENYC